MPTYLYEIIRRDGKPGKQFEIRQGISDPPLKKHPQTGEPVQRIICAPAILGNRFDKVKKQFEREDHHAETQKKEKQYLKTEARKKGLPSRNARRK